MSFGLWFLGFLFALVFWQFYYDVLRHSFILYFFILLWFLGALQTCGLMSHVGFEKCFSSFFVSVKNVFAPFSLFFPTLRLNLQVCYTSLLYSRCLVCSFLYFTFFSLCLKMDISYCFPPTCMSACLPHSRTLSEPHSQCPALLALLI